MMHLTLTRDIVVEGLEINEFDKNHNIIRVVNREEFFSMIDRWKILLLEKYDAKPGQTYFVHGHPGAAYYSCLLAGWELGMVCLFDIGRCNTEADLHTSKTKLFSNMDFTIRTNTHSELFGPGVGTGKFNPNQWYPGPMFRWEFIRAKMYSRNVIDLDEYTDYVVQNPEKYQHVADIRWCTPDSYLTNMPNSGSVNAPRVMGDTHKRVMLTANRFFSYAGLEENERVLHQHNLNHGSTFVVHWIPTIMKCKYHYTGYSTNINNQSELVSVFNQHKINRLMLYTTKLLTNWIRASEPVDHPVRIQTLYQITPEIINLIKEKNIETVFGNFGNQEFGGPLFVKKVTKDTSLDGYEITSVGQPVDDFYKFEIRDGFLYLKCEEIGILDWSTADDKFEEHLGTYYFKGRRSLYRIGEEWFELEALEKKLFECFGEQANLVLDIELQKIYLAVWKPNQKGEIHFTSWLSDTFVQLQLDYVMRDEPVENYSTDRKMDNSKIRDYCRYQLGIRS